MILRHHSVTGIGLETAKVLAANGARIVLGCRDEKRAEEAIDNIKEYCAEHGRKEGVEVSFIPLDLADQVSIHQFAREFDKLSLPLHVLINNAGTVSAVFLCSFFATRYHASAPWDDPARN